MLFSSPAVLTPPPAPWFSAALQAAKSTNGVAIRPLIDEDRLVGLLATETGGPGHKIEGWWLSPIEPGRWVGVRGGHWPGERSVSVNWHRGGWNNFLTHFSGRALIGDDLAHSLRAIRHSLGQAGLGAPDSTLRPEARFFDRMLVDLQETADGLARADLLTRNGALGLAELAAAARITLPPDPSPFARLSATVLIWERLLRPALLTVTPPVLVPLPTAPQPWPLAIKVKVPADAPVHGLLLWFPRGENSPVVVLDIPDLEVLPDAERRSVLLQGHSRAGDIRIRFSPRAAGHLADLLGIAWPLGMPVRSSSIIRVSAGLRSPEIDLTLSSRSITVTFEADSQEPRLPAGAVMRIETIGLPPDPDEGLELLVPLHDGGPLRLRARLEAARIAIH